MNVFPPMCTATVRPPASGIYKFPSDFAEPPGPELRCERYEGHAGPHYHSITDVLARQW